MTIRKLCARAGMPFWVWLELARDAVTVSPVGSRPSLFLQASQTFPRLMLPKGQRRDVGTRVLNGNLTTGTRSLMELGRTLAL